MDDAVSSVYDLSIHADGEEIKTFEAPIRLTFDVDMGKVKVRDHLDMYYYGEEKEE